MNNSTMYSWQADYQCAVLETDSTYMASRIDEALRSIQDRFSSTIQIGEQENAAIESARNALAVLRGEWFGGLSESMSVAVPHGAPQKLNLYRNWEGKTEFLATFTDLHSANARLKGQLALSPGYYVIYDEMTGDRLVFAESTVED
jgi:hypothetical protein